MKACLADQYIPGEDTEGSPACRPLFFDPEAATGDRRRLCGNASG